MAEDSQARRSSASGKLRAFSSERLVREDGDENGRGGDNENAAAGKIVTFAKGKEETDPNAEKIKSVRDRLHKKERRIALNEPELHVIGEIEGGAAFGTGVCCRWQMDYGGAWQHLGGYLEGQTQVDYPTDGDSAVWCHPIDVHLLSKGLQGWPRILLQVWAMDEFGRLNLSGYGFTHVPSAPGSYEIDVETWRPVGTLKEEISALFLGTTPQLRDIDLLFNKAWSDRCRLSTCCAGTVRLNIDVVLRNFHEHNVD